MYRQSIGLSLGVLCVVVLSACSQDPEPVQDPGLLGVVPADTPYVFTNSRRLPDPIAGRLADHAARQLAVQRVAFDELRRQLEEGSGEDDLPERFWQAFDVVDALLAEFEGRETAAQVRELGIEPMPLAVYYGLGILPAARIEILDATQVDAMLDRVERKAGLTAARGSLATQDYRRIDLGPVDAVIALSPDYLIAGLLPDDLFEPMLPVLLGVEAPQQNLAEAGTFSELVERHGFEGYGEGFVRLDTLVASLLGRSSGLNAEVMRALGTERVPGSAACLSLVEELVAGMPRMVVGVSDVDERRLGVRGIWEATDAVSGYLRALAAPVPGVGSEHDGLLAMGLGVELPQLRTAIEALLRHVIAHGRECDWVDPDVIEASIPQLSLVLGPMTAGIKGFHLEIDEMSYEDFQPDAIRASLLAAVDDPRGVFALGSMFNPALGALEVPNDGKLVEMPRELVAGQPTLELRVAIKDKALLLVSGDIDQSEADALFAAPTAEPPPLFAFDYGVAQLVELLSKILDQTAEQMQAQGETELAEELLAQLEDFRLQAEIFERMRVVIYANEQGLVMDQLMELK
jgi:hypothetical protein